MTQSENPSRKENLYTFLARVGGAMGAPAENDFYFVHLPYFDGKTIAEKVRGDTTVYPRTAEEFMFDQREANPDNFLNEHPVNEINKYHPK